MVFENLTMFEIRLENTPFAAGSSRRDEMADDEMVSVSTGGRGRLAAIIALALVTAGVAVLWRRSRASDDVELAADTGAESDLSTAQ